MHTKNPLVGQQPPLSPATVRVIPSPVIEKKEREKETSNLVQNLSTPEGTPQDLMTKSDGWTMVPRNPEPPTEEKKQQAVDPLRKTAQPLYPPKVEEEQKPRDWIKIAGMVVFVIAALFLALSVLCIMGFFPLDLLRGATGVAFTITTSAVIMTVSGCVVYYRWQFPPTPEPEKKSVKRLPAT